MSTITFLALCVSHSSAESNGTTSDHNVGVLLRRVLHSEHGRRIKPVTVVYVIPYVRPASLPPLTPSKSVHSEMIYLITGSHHFYCFYLTPTDVRYAWSTPLVWIHNKTAMEPIGSLGLLLLKTDKAVPNSVSAGTGMGHMFLSAIESRQPLIIYRVAKGKLVRDGEQYY